MRPSRLNFLPSLSAILLILFTVPVHSQTGLLKFSRDMDIAWRSERAAAESIALRLGMPVRGTLSDGSTIELQKITEGRPFYFITENAVAAATISTVKLYPAGGAGYGLTGGGVTLGEWDGGGVRSSHQELVGRVYTTEGSFNYHSTHVAGTMIASGIVPAAKGMAYQAGLRAFDWNSDISEMASEAAAGLKVSNHSYGFITGWRWNYFGDNKWVWFGDASVSPTEDYLFGFYDGEARSWDQIANAAPYYLPVKSAGNDRNEGPVSAQMHWYWTGSAWDTIVAARSKDGNGGYDCISGAGIAKNAMTVGSVSDIPAGYSTPSGVVMTTYSAWGPTDDGRIKPDVVANGAGLYSTFETADNDYGSLGGTSMAAPCVTGSIGLLLQHQTLLHGPDSLLASTLKAIVLHTADEAGNFPGPDYVFGWGLMNTLKAVDLMQLDADEGTGVHVRELSMDDGDTLEVVVSSRGDEPLRATLTWNDPAALTPAAALDPTDTILVHDVDMRIVRISDGAEYLPWILDPSNPSSGATRGDNFRDNVEQVLVDSTIRGTYLVRLTHKGSLTAVPARLSLVVSGNVPRIGPMMTVAAETLSHSILPGEVIVDSFMVRNLGDTALHGPITPGGGDFWLTPATDSIAIPSLDSGWITYTVDGSLLSQWTQYNGELTIETNDSLSSPLVLPVGVAVTGPTIHREPWAISMNLDSGQVGSDSVVIRNDGYIPLGVVIGDSSGTYPAWISADPDTLLIPPADSATVIFTINSTNEPLGRYETAVVLASNDSATGPVTVPVWINIGVLLEFPFGVTPRWNIVSLPVEPVSPLKAGIFPGASTAAFAFDDGYAVKDTLSTGAGYWIKFPGAQEILLEGYTFTGTAVGLRPGWNLVGSVSGNIAATSLATDPGDVLISGFFGYDGGYYLTDSIMAGTGYWVQAAQEGVLYLSAAPGAAPKASLPAPPEPDGILYFRDALGNTQRLHFSNSPSSLTGSAMPPPPPAGAFDVRYADDRSLAVFDGPAGERDSRIILVRGPGGMLSVSASLTRTDSFRYSIRDAAGEIHALQADRSVRLSTDGSDQAEFLLVREPVELPRVYALEQNYPNPFNPSTSISFSLPEAGLVSIKLYNILGNEVATIVERQFGAGKHSVEFNGDALPSGVYIYKMRANSFTSGRKMVLMR